MTSHPADHDEDYHESVSFQAPREWATASSKAHPSAGPLPWRYTRAHSTLSGNTAWSLREPHLLRRDNDVDVTSTRITSCLHDVIIAIGIVAVLSIIALVFIATVGLNNQASVT